MRAHESARTQVKALLHAGEMLYIATDETEPNFFEPFEKAGHKVLRVCSCMCVCVRARFVGGAQQCLRLRLCAPE
jgi:hypothetical protein